MKFSDLKVGMVIRKIGEPTVITAVGKESAIGLRKHLDGFEHEHEIFIDEDHLDEYEEVINEE